MFRKSEFSITPVNNHLELSTSTINVNSDNFNSSINNTSNGSVTWNRIPEEERTQLDQLDRRRLRGDDNISRKRARVLELQLSEQLYQNIRLAIQSSSPEDKDRTLFSYAKELADLASSVELKQLLDKFSLTEIREISILCSQLAPSVREDLAKHNERYLLLELFSLKKDDLSLFIKNSEITHNASLMVTFLSRILPSRQGRVWEVIFIIY